jgi:DNA-directed RNA polymerase specialized sigma24 family protein
MADRSRGVLGRASRGLVAEIDEQLARLDAELAPHERLLAERERLRAARATLLGESPAAQTPRISQEDVAAYLKEHPGSRAGEVAKALGVPLTTVSAHLYRGKLTLFVSRGDGWHVRERPAKDKAQAKGQAGAKSHPAARGSAKGKSR